MPDDSTLSLQVISYELVIPEITLELAGVGLQGPPGPAGVSYTHTQSMPSNTWIINHNLGFMPIVQVFGQTNEQISVSIYHHSVNQVRLFFNWMQSGFARLV